MMTTRQMPIRARWQCVIRNILVHRADQNGLTETLLSIKTVRERPHRQRPAINQHKQHQLERQ